MQQTKLLYIFNILEDMIDAIKTLNNEDKNAILKQYEQAYNQTQILSVISRYPKKSKYYFVFLHEIDGEHLQYICKILEVSKERIQIFVPKKLRDSSKQSISLCLLDDQQLLNKIKNLSNFQLLSFCMSEQYLRLYDALKEQADPIQFTPRQKWQKIQRFGTKPGIRELVQKLGDPKVFLPKGKILYRKQNSYDDIISFIANQLKNQSVVVKTDKLSAGKGVAIIKAEEVQGLSQKEIESYVRQRLSYPFWKCFDIVVQQLIDLDPIIGSPMTQIFIDKQGAVSIIWVCSMYIQNQCQFLGIQNGKQLIQKEISDKMVYISLALGKVYSELGYCGNINIDLLLDKKRVVYVGESNVRRSWPIFANNLGQYLLGKNYYENYYLRTQYFYQEKIKNFKTMQLINGIKELGLDYTKQKKSGIILTSAISCLKAQMIYFIIIAKNIEQAGQMDRKFKQKFDL